MRIAILGCGTMGNAYCRAFLQYDLVAKDDLLLIEKDQQRLEKLRAEIGGGIPSDTIGPHVSDFELLILAIKPQDFASAQALLRPVVGPQQTILSIMAGLPIAKIQGGIGVMSVVRAMPNTPATLGMGMTAYFAAPEVEPKLLRRIETLLGATGRTVELDDESMLDAVTAVSGSGPAYYYLFVKCMVEAAMEMGFDRAMANLLVKQTMLGAYHLMQTSEATLDELIAAVASRGGTTEAALKEFESRGFAQAVHAALGAARSRAEELSRS